jgi:hypothetical protein
MYKILGGDGKEYGPVSADVLRQWIAQGRAIASTKVQPEGSADWIPLSQLPEFASSLASISAPHRPLQSQPGSTSGLAIASLVCGALGLFVCVTSPVGMVLGIMAQSQIKKSNGQIKGSGLAIAGIVLSAITCVLFVIGVFAGMMIPALARAKGKAQEINCMNNLKQLGLGVKMYASANNGQFPYATNWCDAINSFVGSAKAFQCPAAQTGQGQSSYAFNASLSGLNETNINPATVLLFEVENGWNASGGSEDMIVDRHKSRTVNVVVCFADGSVKRMPKSQLDTLRWEP